MLTEVVPGPDGVYVKVAVGAIPVNSTVEGLKVPPAETGVTITLLPSAPLAPTVKLVEGAPEAPRSGAA